MLGAPKLFRTAQHFLLYDNTFIVRAQSAHNTLIAQLLSFHIENLEVKEHWIPARDVRSSVEVQSEANLVNFVRGPQEPQARLRKDEIIDAPNSPH